MRTKSANGHASKTVLGQQKSQHWLQCEKNYYKVFFLLLMFSNTFLVIRQQYSQWPMRSRQIICRDLIGHFGYLCPEKHINLSYFCHNFHVMLHHCTPWQQCLGGSQIPVDCWYFMPGHGSVLPVMVCKHNTCGTGPGHHLYNDIRAFLCWLS